MGTFSPIHWVLVAIVILLVFGPKTLSKLGRGVGQGMRSINKLKRIGDDPLRVVENVAKKSERPRANSDEQAKPVESGANEAEGEAKRVTDADQQGARGSAGEPADKPAQS